MKPTTSKNTHQLDKLINMALIKFILKQYINYNMQAKFIMPDNVIDNKINGARIKRRIDDIMDEIGGAVNHGR